MPLYSLHMMSSYSLPVGVRIFFVTFLGLVYLAGKPECEKVSVCWPFIFTVNNRGFWILDLEVMNKG